jgi:putative ABC transport system ATP-binding protein
MPNNENSLIELEEVKKSYRLGDGSAYQALNGVTLRVDRGEFVAIMGPSGSGKSTVMHIMGALDMPTEGRYFFKGRNISQYSEDQLANIRNQEIGFIFQAFNLLPRTTVFKNVERPMLYANISKKEREKKVLKALELVDLSDKSQNLSNHISGGQVQRVAIARALIMSPSLILADEPTGNIDSKTAQGIMNLLKDLNDKGRTIVLITHDEHVAKTAKRKVKLVDGKIVSDNK